jgi:hypothetical protein
MLRRFIVKIIITISNVTDKAANSLACLDLAVWIIIDCDKCFLVTIIRGV